MLRCSLCRKEKTTDCFTPRPNRRRGYMSRCKECINLSIRLKKYGRTEKIRQFTNQDSPYYRATSQLKRSPTRIYAGIGCWEWAGKVRDKRGYATFSVDGRLVGVHRWAYEHFTGAIPDGFEIDHLCENPRCAEPRHLEAVTPQENRRRRLGRPLPLRCAHGHELDAGTLYVNKRTGNWLCRICQAGHARARRLRLGGGRAARKGVTTPHGPAVIRRWALENGFKVATKGLLPQTVIAAYQARHVAIE